MKGIFYSTIAVLFLAPLLLFALTTIQGYETTSEVLTTKIVGEKLASYAASIDADLPRAVEIMAKRALTSAVIHVENNGTGLADAAGTLRELMENGTINGTGTATNFTLTSWTSLLQSKGALYGFTTQVLPQSLNFSSIDSATVGVSIVISVNATYPGAQMGLYRVYHQTVDVRIEGLDDPLYTLNSNGILKRSIRMGTGISDVASLDSAAGAGIYLSSSTGPGFLDRLEGRKTPSGKYGNGANVTGLASIVFLPDFQSIGIPIKENLTTIDFLYFSGGTAGQRVNSSSYGWLRLDPPHAALYNVSLLP